MSTAFGIKVLEERASAINGKIRVVRSLGLGTYIQVQNLTQSGGVVFEVWRSTLKNLKNSSTTFGRKTLKLKNCLILGLGGGSAAALVRKFWPEAKITGVDIDPVMVELGRKYLRLEGIKVVISDASEFLKTKPKFDLILIDTYIGYKFPERLEEQKFLEAVKKALSHKGLAIFNRLYMVEKRPETVKFALRLEKIFSKVEYFYPEANVMLLCYN